MGRASRWGYNFTVTYLATDSSMTRGMLLQGSVDLLSRVMMPKSSPLLHERLSHGAVAAAIALHSFCSRAECRCHSDTHLDIDDDRAVYCTYHTTQLNLNSTGGKNWSESFSEFLEVKLSLCVNRNRKLFSVQMFVKVPLKL